MTQNRNIITYAILFAVGGVFFLGTSCERPTHQETGNASESESTSQITAPSKTKAQKVSFFVDNSGGMFGYVETDESQDGNDFRLAVSNLSQNRNFSSDDVTRDFNLINGPREIVITPLGDRAQGFINCLNPTCFNQGDISGNDYNAMFQMILEKTGGKDISVFISDGIYDIQNKTQPTTSLRSEGFETRNKFIDRLENENIQTLLIKLNSHFVGNYFYGATTGGLRINQKRPYYVFVFGKSEILNNYFEDSYIEDLDGYTNHTRFFLPDEYNIDYQPSTAYNRVGNFRSDRRDSHVLTDVSRDQRGEFEFSIGVDYSELPLSDQYLRETDHYSVTGNFEIVNIEEYHSSMVTNITSFEPSHLITLRATGIPQGQVDIKLLNVLPSWVEESHTDDDQGIEGDTQTTFGFKYLIEGVVDAYTEVSEYDYFVTKTVTLRRN